LAITDPILMIESWVNQHHPERFTRNPGATCERAPGRDGVVKKLSRTVPILMDGAPIIAGHRSANSF